MSRQISSSFPRPPCQIRQLVKLDPRTAPLSKWIPRSGPLSNPPTPPAHQCALSSSDASLSVPNKAYIRSRADAASAPSPASTGGSGASHATFYFPVRPGLEALCQIMSNSCQIRPTPRGPLSNLRQIRTAVTRPPSAAPPNSAAARPSVKSRQCPSNFRPPSGPYYPPRGTRRAD